MKILCGTWNPIDGRWDIANLENVWSPDEVASMNCPVENMFDFPSRITYILFVKATCSVQHVCGIEWGGCSNWNACPRIGVIGDLACILLHRPWLVFRRM